MKTRTWSSIRLACQNQHVYTEEQAATEVVQTPSWQCFLGEWMGGYRCTGCAWGSAGMCCFLAGCPVSWCKWCAGRHRSQALSFTNSFKTKSMYRKVLIRIGSVTVITESWKVACQCLFIFLLLHLVILLIRCDVCQNTASFAWHQHSQQCLRIHKLKLFDSITEFINKH